MSTVVYLANRQIQVVTGTPGTKKITVNECYFGEAPDGSIINGMVMDQELFAGFMRDFWAMYNLPTNDVVLVINSSKFVGKNIEMPSMNDKKTLEFIKREFADVTREEDYLFGYIPIGTVDKMKKLYVEAIYPEFIREYLDIFSEIGVKVNAIYSGESSLIGLVSMTLGRKYKTFIIQIADRMTITTLLWVNGSFYYFNSTRCFHEQGTEDYANDIAKSVSQIIQFMQAHQIEYPLEAVVLAGINPYAFPLYREAIMNRGVNAPIEVFTDGSIMSSGVDVQNTLHAACGLVQNGKYQNFLTIYNANKKKAKKEESGVNIKSFIGIGVTLLVMILALAVCAFIRIGKKKELKKLTDYNNDPAIMMEVARYEVLLERNSFLMAQYNAIDNIDENILTYPLGNNVVMNEIYKCAGYYAEISFESFDAQAGQFQFVAKADSVENINVFIKNLTEQEIFSDIEYTGYSYQDDTDMWDIHVICTLAEAAGRGGTDAKESSHIGIGSDDLAGDLQSKSRANTY